MSRANETAAVSATAAIGSLLAALTCCLPLTPILGAVGLAGAAAILDPLRPYLFAASFACLGFGFWRAYRQKSCAVRSRTSVVILWSALAALVLVLLWPQAIAGFLADVLPHPEAR